MTQQQPLPRCDGSSHSPGRAGHDVVDVGPLEAVEGGGGGHRVGAHVLEDQPVAHLQVGQAALLHDAVQAVAGRAPDAAGVHGLVGLWLLREEGRLVIGRRDTESTVRSESLLECPSPYVVLANSVRGRRVYS